VAPSSGVVVRWRIKVGAPTAPVALRVIRRPRPLSQAKTGGGTGPTVTPPTNQTKTYDVRLPIFAGNAVGIDYPPAGMFPFAGFSGTSGASLARWQPALVDNDPPRVPTNSFSDIELLVNADIEPDADADGFGDEPRTSAPGRRDRRAAARPTMAVAAAEGAAAACRRSKVDPRTISPSAR
jgi:hypothetical protein